jgi:hypothetical protein
MIVHAALHYRIDLNRREACSFRRVKSGQYVRHTSPIPVHTPEYAIIQAVQADRHAPQSSRFEHPGFLRQQVPVRRHREIVHPIDLGKLID